MKPEKTIVNVFGTKNISIVEFHKMGSSSLRLITNPNIKKRQVDLENTDMELVIPIRPFRERIISGHLQDLTDLRLEGKSIIGILSDDSLFEIFQIDDYFNMSMVIEFIDRLQDGYYKTFIGTQDDITKQGVNFLVKVYDKRTIKNTWWFDGHAWPGYFNSYLYDLSNRNKNIKFVKLKNLSSEMFSNYLKNFDSNWNGVTISKVNDKSKLKEQLSQFDILAYPSTFEETCCNSVIEAISTGLRVITTSYASMPEVTEGWAKLYPHYKNRDLHVKAFARLLKQEIEACKEGIYKEQSQLQREVYGPAWSWDERVYEWEDLLSSL